MEVFCLEEFKREFYKLKKNNSYNDIEAIIAEFFFGKDVKQFIGLGSKLSGSSDFPFIKMRLKGRGGYRLYYLLFIKDSRLYLMFIHPKTGSLGTENISISFQREIYASLLEAIKTNNLYKLEANDRKLSFTHLAGNSE